MEGPGATSGLWGVISGPWGTISGPCGAASETLANGLGLTISLGPADGDLLAEPTCSQRGGLSPLNTSIISLSLAKAEFIRLASKATAGGREGGCCLLTLFDIEPQLYYQQFEYSLILLNSLRYPPNVDQGAKLPLEETHGTPEKLYWHYHPPQGGDLALDLASRFETRFK